MKISNRVKLNAKVDFSGTNSNYSTPSYQYPDNSGPRFESRFRDLEESKESEEYFKKYITLTAYSSIYSAATDKLKRIIKSVDSIRYFYLVDVMISQIAEDALAPQSDTDELFKYSCTDKFIQKELDDLQARLDLDQIIENIAPDILAYGEYTLSTKIIRGEEKKDELGSGEKYNTKSKGLVDIVDSVDQGTVISLTKDGKVAGYLQYDESLGKIEVKEVSDFIKFSLSGQRIKVSTDNFIPRGHIKNPIVKEIVDSIPKFIRIGKSIIYPVIPKIKELEILEKLVPATKINKLSQGNLVGVTVPENYEIEQALKTVRRIEGMVNKKISVDPSTQEITVESILSTAGKTKVIPIFGDKGRLEQLDFKSNEPDDLLSSTKDIRELILDSIGIPTELVFKSDGDGKAEILKRYGKYLRKLKRLRKCIISGLKDIAFIHLDNKGIKYKPEEIGIDFHNSLVEIDNLDKLEHADVTLSLLNNVKTFFDDLAQEESKFKNMVNLNKVAQYIERNLEAVGLSDAITPDKEEKNDIKNYDKGRYIDKDRSQEPILKDKYDQEGEDDEDSK